MVWLWKTVLRHLGGGSDSQVSHPDLATNMTRNPQWLLDHSSNKYSQTGEDGVIAKTLSLLPETDGWCVEFGAWDGVYLSNVRRLILEERYRAILIEGDRKKFKSLKANFANNKDVETLCRFVGFGDRDGLDEILSSYRIPTNFDFLSIDIDGNDYHVWEAVKEYRPKVVCVEFNPTIPSEVHFVQTPDPRIAQGCSLLALYELARVKSYELVCVLPFNAFFVAREYFAAFEIADNSPPFLRKDLSAITWLFSGFDGSVHLAGSKRMPWHGLSIDERGLQVLPRILRSYPENYTFFQRRLLRLVKTLRLFRNQQFSFVPRSMELKKKH